VKPVWAFHRAARSRLERLRLIPAVALPRQARERRTTILYHRATKADRACEAASPPERASKRSPWLGSRPSASRPSYGIEDALPTPAPVAASHQGQGSARRRLRPVSGKARALFVATLSRLNGCSTRRQRSAMAARGSARKSRLDLVIVLRSARQPSPGSSKHHPGRARQAGPRVLRTPLKLARRG